jgi:hypothetical protein
MEIRFDGRAKHEIVGRERGLHQCRVNPHQRGDLVDKGSLWGLTKPLRWYPKIAA